MALHAQNTVIAVKKLWPDVIALTGGTVNASTVTGLTAVLPADYYRGGKLKLLDGNQAGRVYKITANTTSSITVDRATLTETGNAVTNSDRVALFNYRSVPYDQTDEWLLIDNSPSFVPTQEWEDLYAQRTGGLPYRKDSYLKARPNDITLEYTFQDAEFLPLIFGQVVDTGTDKGSGGSSTLSATAYAGENVVSVASAANFAADDYIRVGPAASGEIRKITDVTGTDITLDNSLRRTHASGVTVIEMDESEVFTHTFTMHYNDVFRQWPFVIKSLYNAVDHANMLHMFTHYQVGSFTFKNDGDKLMVSVGLKGYNFSYDHAYYEGAHDGLANAAVLTDTSANFYAAGVQVGMTVYNTTDGSSGTITAVGKTTITATLAGGTESDWDIGDLYYIDVYEAPTEKTDTPALYYNSEVKINGVVDGVVRTVEASGDYQAEVRYYHNDYSEGYPSEVVYKRATNNMNLGVRVDDGKFLSLLLAGSKFDTICKYNLNSAGTHYVTITATNNRPNSVPHPFPAGGPIDTDLSMTNQYFTVVVVDDEPYY